MSSPSSWHPSRGPEQEDSSYEPPRLYPGPPQMMGVLGQFLLLMPWSLAMPHAFSPGLRFEDDGLHIVSAQ